jgi:hypothetical protein
MHRSNQDESKFSDAEKLAWEYILPFRHLFIMESERIAVKKLTLFLEKMFSKKALKTAVSKIVERD